jgi:metal-dependent amidase/aminoacylase/carboxypeptidase family protein
MDTDLTAAMPTVRPIIDEVIAAVHGSPELAYEEVRTSGFLMERLEDLGARVSQPVADFHTCFRAEIGPEDGPAVGIVLPLDAIPMHVGDGGTEPFNALRPVHACGHSLIAGALVGAVQLLSTSPQPLAGRLVVMGIPGDEIHAPEVRARGGGKATTAKLGVWDDLDAVLYAHPEFLDTVWSSSRWMNRCRITVGGPRAFAADGPDILAAFADILQRCRQVASRYGAEWFVIESASFEGDVEDGSPCGAELSVLVFASSEEELHRRLHELDDLIRDIGTDGGFTAQTRVDDSIYAGILPNTVLRSAIASVFGESYVTAPGELPFATDFGNLSRRAPSALIGIGREGGWPFHTSEGAEEFASQAGRDVAARLALVLASSVSLLTSDRALLTRARGEFEARLVGDYAE